MRNEVLQKEIEKVRNETAEGGNTCERIASILTALNDDKASSSDAKIKLNKDGTDITEEEKKSLKTNLGLGLDIYHSNTDGGVKDNNLFLIRKDADLIAFYRSDFTIESGLTAEGKNYNMIRLVKDSETRTERAYVDASNIKLEQWQTTLSYTQIGSAEDENAENGINLFTPKTLAFYEGDFVFTEIGNGSGKYVVQTKAKIPTNVATIDEGAVLGNVHTKEQIAELLENSGKNLGNTDLVIPPGKVWTLDVTDAKLQFKGLSMVGNDASFNLKPKFNAQGELKLTEEAEVKITFPENLNIAVTNTFVQPNTVGTPATYTEEIKAVMDQIPTLTLTPILGSDLTLKVFEDRVLPSNTPIRISTTGEVFLLATNDKVFQGIPYTQESVSAYSNVRLPANKNWVLKVIGSFTDGGRSENYSEIGLARTTPENPIFYGLQNGNYTTYQIKGSNPVQRIPRGTDGSYTMYILKTGGVVTVVLYSNGECKVFSFNAFEELGDYIPKGRLNSYGYYHNTFKMSYKILT